ncbi:hypothetical protein LshimejAT787_0311810 [Lyophyllum shimeji]|uniref:Uncharacterized protein n=1 Tax=Lyophyllum shimeji TaxID=47721 RepID=A0A9P3UJE8_LYOSH|nr:hypothetical protein LshimejAT787_0311810 [Lyophyllum shimeji]
MAFNNPLHPPVAPAQRSTYTTLGNALDCGAEPSQPLSPCVRRLPQARWTPACKWKLATGRTNALHSAVTFDVHGYGYSKQGVPMRELSTRSANALAEVVRGADDQVLAHTGLRRIILRILVSLSEARACPAVLLLTVFISALFGLVVAGL